MGTLLTKPLEVNNRSPIEIDCDLPPILPSFPRWPWSVVHHRKQGIILHNRNFIHLERSKYQGVIPMWKFIHEFTYERIDRPVANTNLLDFYLKNPSRIPPDWKPCKIYFLGTIFQHPNFGQCVKYLFLPDRNDFNQEIERGKLYDDELKVPTSLRPKILSHEMTRVSFERRVAERNMVWRSALHWFDEQINTNDSLCAVHTKLPNGEVEELKEREYQEWKVAT